MTKKKTFRVYAKVITYSYIDIEADNEDEANEKAEEQLQTDELDGGDFFSCERGGEFELAPDSMPTHEVKN